MIAHGPRRLQTKCTLLAALLAACSSPGGPADVARTLVARDAGSAPARAAGIGRAGPVTLDLDGLRVAVEEARVLQTWIGGEAPPADALESVMLRRRVLTKALETRVVRLEVARRGLTVPPDELEGLLRAAALGKGLQPLAGPPLEDLDARLVARFAAPPARVARVARDLVCARLLTEALLDDVDDATLRGRWADEKTTVRLDLVGIPRVPASKEIDAAVRERADAIGAWYTQHRSRFVRPERAVLSRIFVAFGPDRAASRAKVDGLRARVVAGEDFAAVATADSEGPNARRGGRLGALSKKQLPAGFDVPERDGLTPVLEEREGWAFYRTEGRLPAMSRTLDEAPVKREIAATLLREADDLPHARATAERARALLMRAPDGEALAALVATERLRRRTTEPFRRSGRSLVPSVGLAPKLFAAAFELTAEAPVSAVFPVRQAYLVARRVERVDADLAAWPAERSTWIEAWRGRQRASAIEDWLGERLRGEKMWVDMERLRALTLADLGLK